MRTAEGLALVECFGSVQSQLRMGPMGPVGLDMPAALDVLEAHGIDRRVAALLLPSAERGLMQAFAALRRDNPDRS